MFFRSLLDGHPHFHAGLKQSAASLAVGRSLRFYVELIPFCVAECVVAKRLSHGSDSFPAGWEDRLLWFVDCSIGDDGLATECASGASSISGSEVCASKYS